MSRQRDHQTFSFLARDIPQVLAVRSLANSPRRGCLIDVYPRLSILLVVDDKIEILPPIFVWVYTTGRTLT